MPGDRRSLMRADEVITTPRAFALSASGLLRRDPMRSGAPPLAAWRRTDVSRRDRSSARRVRTQLKVLLVLPFFCDRRCPVTQAFGPQAAGISRQILASGGGSMFSAITAPVWPHLAHRALVRIRIFWPSPSGEPS
jgi:hypothetical protein